MPPKRLSLIHGEVRLPAFMPDATSGMVHAVDASDLEHAGVEALVMNVFHLMQKPGSSTIQALGGLHAMTAWPRPIVTDSGGFQVYSLIRQNPKLGGLSDQGVRFQPEHAGRRFLLTPEKSVQLQVAYGADVVMCLDDCTHVDDPFAEQRVSVERTIRWARRCKAEFERQGAQRGWTEGRRPLVFGVVQGGGDKALRGDCAATLLEIGFDGFGYGGWPLNNRGELLDEMLAVTRSFIPPAFPMHALGVGHPENVLACARLGYDLFDSALPTRDARHGRLYVYTSDPTKPDFRLQGEWSACLYIHDKKHIKTKTPLSPGCDCHTCSTYTIGYLHHLAKSDESLFCRLATIHNVRFMMRLIGLIAQHRTMNDER